MPMKIFSLHRFIATVHHKGLKNEAMLLTQLYRSFLTPHARACTVVLPMVILTGNTSCLKCSTVPHTVSRSKYFKGLTRPRSGLPRHCQGRERTYFSTNGTSIHLLVQQHDLCSTAINALTQTMRSALFFRFSGTFVNLFC
ncbi:hypothetical protein VCUG_00358 [Vavraia culicis subsp. floridensis]|uniref:Uncharacterized protein n=1 Tax=Vavraia culicis (isolate floridensis) TaxID=948595 RepID=L2GYE7_VAVCU|nr:uncharacterized protein VCUG_00358 [Vavraia culicis subsp. floridensis]ELA48120.1 hypothetical protein VCUG_00358 [Vavraia culicis subsp. floridensis]